MLGAGDRPTVLETPPRSPRRRRAGAGPGGPQAGDKQPGVPSRPTPALDCECKDPTSSADLRGVCRLPTRLQKMLTKGGTKRCSRGLVRPTGHDGLLGPLPSPPAPVPRHLRQPWSSWAGRSTREPQALKRPEDAVCRRAGGTGQLCVQIGAWKYSRGGAPSPGGAGRPRQPPAGVPRRGLGPPPRLLGVQGPHRRRGRCGLLPCRSAVRCWDRENSVEDGAHEGPRPGPAHPMWASTSPGRRFRARTRENGGEVRDTFRFNNLLE